ncbi:hypothetical protein [Dechloromonas sp. ZS-1]|uniref:hypothetical protein n=1 Tax=Dechloromonas sp. ZS-1 TaxID=3138067 RepID=UPI0031FD4DB1
MQIHHFQTNQHQNQPNPVLPETNFYKKSVLSPALQSMLLDIEPQWHITANFNRETSLRTGSAKLKTWASFIDRKLFGRNYYKKPNDQRLFFFAFPEIGSESEFLHYHLLAKLPETRHQKFTELAEQIWLDEVKTGSLYVQRIGNDESDLQRVISYDLKDIWKRGNYDNFIISSEFAPSPSETSRAQQGTVQ